MGLRVRPHWGGLVLLSDLGQVNLITLRNFVSLQVCENWILCVMKKKKKRKAMFKETTTGMPVIIKAYQEDLQKLLSTFELLFVASDQN